MSRNNFLENLIYRIVKKYLAVPEVNVPSGFHPENILVVRQHNQLGDMLAGVSLFRGLKEKYPACKITLIAGPQNYYAIEKNKYIDRLFTFNKKKLLNPLYLKKIMDVLKGNYDIVIVPVTVSVSFTSNLISRLSDARIRIGPASLDGIKNKSDFLFNKKVDIDWRHEPDSNVSERILDIVRPLKVTASSYKTEISFTSTDIHSAEEFIKSLNKTNNQLLIGLHVGAGKPQNRWSLVKYVSVIEELEKAYNAKFYFTGSNTDNEEIDYMKKNLQVKAGYFLNRKIPEVAALISLSDLFISNDTGIMHVAGASDTPQVTVFGPTNPYNWAPVGDNKYFIRKSELIDDIDTEDVLGLCKMILDKKTGKIKVAGL